MPNHEREPKIITNEKEAREEFRRLISYGFTVRQPGQVLSEDDFVEAMECGVHVWAKKFHSSGDVSNPEVELYANTLGRTDPHEAYTTLTESGFVPYEPGKILEEDEFILVASEIGGVDLERPRFNGELFRTFGTRIGYSNSDSDPV